MFFTTSGKAAFPGHLCTLLRGEGRKRVHCQLRLLFLFLGGAFDIVGSVGTAIALSAHLELVSGRVTTVAQLCTREKCSVRHVNMTISLAFLAPNLIKAAVEGRLPRGIGIERLRDPPTEWSRQFEALGLNPE